MLNIFFQGVIILDSNGESCDGDTSEAEDDRLREARVEASNNFVFVGAEIRTGKSTIRSKQSKRKVSISLGNKLCSIIATPVWRTGEPTTYHQSVLLIHKLPPDPFIS